MKDLFARFARDESGATAIEYALIAVGIAIVVGAAAATLGGAISTKFGAITSTLTGGKKG